MTTAPASGLGPEHLQTGLDLDGGTGERKLIGEDAGQRNVPQPRLADGNGMHRHIKGAQELRLDADQIGEKD